jgi:hypothetical protein
MGNDNKSWEKEFAAFERDLDGLETPTAPSEELDFSYSDISFDQPEPQPVEPEPEQEPEQTEPVTEEPPAAKPEPIVNEEKPRRVFPPLTANDMTRLQARLDESIAAAIPLRDQTQRMMDDHDDIRLPKGLRTAAKLLTETASVLIATKAVIDLFLELGVEPLYQSVDDNGLKTAIRNAAHTIKAHMPTMQEGLDDIEKAMTEGGYDRPSANLRMRIVKAQAQNTQSLALQQAQALIQTIDAFPLENGALRLLCLIQEKGDKSIMDSIDHTMKIAGHVQVPVADAPAMLQAVQNNDQNAVDAIVNRMIQNVG